MHSLHICMYGQRVCQADVLCCLQFKPCSILYSHTHAFINSITTSTNTTHKKVHHSIGHGNTGGNTARLVPSATHAREHRCNKYSRLHGLNVVLISSYPLGVRVLVPAQVPRGHHSEHPFGAGRGHSAGLAPQRHIRTSHCCTCATLPVANHEWERLLGIVRIISTGGLD